MPSSDNKIIVNSGTLVKNLRTTDSSEIASHMRRDSSEKKVIRASPFQAMRVQKSTSQYTLKPKLKIVKNKGEPVYLQKEANPFKKPFMKNFNYNTKHVGISPGSRVKVGDGYRDKKGRKKSHKRAGSHASATKSQMNLGKSQTAITEDSKAIRKFPDGAKTQRSHLVVKNLFSQKSFKGKFFHSPKFSKTCVQSKQEKKGWEERCELFLEKLDQQEGDYQL